MIRGLNLTLFSLRTHPMIAQASWDHFPRIDDVIRFVAANIIKYGVGLARDSREAGNELFQTKGGENGFNFCDLRTLKSYIKCHLREYIICFQLTLSKALIQIFAIEIYAEMSSRIRRAVNNIN